MRVEHGLYNTLTGTSCTTNAQPCYSLKSEKDSVSFGAKINGESLGFLAKLTRDCREFINPEAKRLRLEAEDKARKEQAERLRKKMAEEKKQRIINAKTSAEKMLEDWNSRNKGLFQERICKDETGDIIMCESRMNPKISEYAGVKEPPKRGEYTLANFGYLEGYKTIPSIGQSRWYLRGDNSERSMITHLMGPSVDTEEFKDCVWKMQHGYTQSKIDGSWHKCTVLTSGFYDKGAYALCRYPGVNILVEGHIPIEEMSEIKKDIVEKGLWQNFIDKQDNEALVGIYNEMLNHLNKSQNI